MYIHNCTCAVPGKERDWEGVAIGNGDIRSYEKWREIKWAESPSPPRGLQWIPTPSIIIVTVTIFSNKYSFI